MDRALLMIIAIVLVVGAVGVLTVLPQQSAGSGAEITGRVVEGAQIDACATCTGDPVCGGKQGKAVNYANACAAQCDGARVIYDGICERIPRAS